MVKCVFVIGPESSGSKLIARVCSHALGVRDFEAWDGTGWIDCGAHKVCHRSLPYGKTMVYPDIDRWLLENADSYELFFILTTRDIHISEKSRLKRWGKKAGQAKQESANARKIMLEVMDLGHPYFIWSYETFMFLGSRYLKDLYRFLNCESDFMPILKDSNISKVIRS